MELIKNTRNKMLTPMNPQCRICHFSGYSNDCSFFTTGYCPMVKALKSTNQIKKTNKLMII